MRQTAGQLTYRLHLLSALQLGLPFLIQCQIVNDPQKMTRAVQLQFRYRQPDRNT